MEAFWWMVIVATITMVLFRLLFTQAAFPINRQVIRHLLLQRLSVLCPGMEILAESDHEVALTVQGTPCSISLDQLYRRCGENPPLSMRFIRQAAQGFQQALQEDDALPTNWEQQVVPLLFHHESPQPQGLFTRHQLDELSLGYALDGGDTFRWITQPMLKASPIDEEQLHHIAIRNLERSCNRLAIDSPGTEENGQDRILRFITGDGLDATRLILPSFFQRFSQRFGDQDLLVGIPARDALTMIASSDHSLTTILAWQSNREHAQRAYPLTPRLMQVSEAGVHAWHAAEASETIQPMPS